MKKLTEIEINEILKAHELWVDTDGKEGKRADFSNQNLERATFEDANLYDANFKNANLDRVTFEDANLMDANFECAYLTGAYLTGAYLTGANFKNANLMNANLFGANLYGTGIFTFQIKYFAFFHQSTAYPNGYLLRIGCKDYFDIDDRIVRNDEIGKEFEYTEKEIKRMLGILNFIKKEYLT